jgi:hypothetical protein
MRSTIGVQRTLRRSTACGLGEAIECDGAYDDDAQENSLTTNARTPAQFTGTVSQLMRVSGLRAVEKLRRS